MVIARVDDLWITVYMYTHEYICAATDCFIFSLQHSHKEESAENFGAE